MTSPPLITLMTDFGTQDTYVAQMKGVVLGICPTARLVDLTHHIPPQDVEHASLALSAAVDAFPPQTIHVIVVDPTVGSARRIVAVTADERQFVCPDNGLLTSVLAQAQHVSVVAVSHTAYVREPVSRVFHGRDIMAPVAAHWANGVDAGLLGTTMPADDLIRLRRPSVTRRQSASGQTVLETTVERVDHFGNAITGLSHTVAGADGQVVLPEAGQSVPLVTHYSERPDEPLVALFGSGGFLELAVPAGNAADSWNLQRGTRVEWHFPHDISDDSLM